jgi:hypothetical protein
MIPRLRWSSWSSCCAFATILACAEPQTNAAPAAGGGSDAGSLVETAGSAAQNPDGGADSSHAPAQAGAGGGGASGTDAGSSGGGGTAGAHVDDTGGGAGASQAGTANGGAGVTSKSGIVHPGLLNSLGELAAIKQHLARGEEPWTTELAHLKARVAARTLHTPPNDRKIFCGGHNLDENGKKILECDYAVENGIDAYSLALLGYLTDSQRDSDEAIRFISAWADNFQGFDPEPRPGAQGNNALLQAGWTAPWFANAAEILRYTFARWTAELTRRETAFLKLLLPQVSDETQANPANWLHSRIEAHVAIAIFLDDPVMLERATRQWQANTPSYFYIASDGALPPKPHRSISDAALAKLWDTPEYLPGMTMETCRDLGHQGLGVRSIFNTLAMAHVQGRDLLAGNDIRERLRTFLEEQAKWMLAKKDPDGACNEPIIVQVSPVTTYMASAQPVPYEYGGALLGAPVLPTASAAIKARPSTAAARWVTKWETLTRHFDPSQL